MGFGVGLEVQWAPEEGKLRVLGENPDPEEDTTLVGIHTAGNQVQVQVQVGKEAQSVVHKADRILGTGAVGDSQEELDEGPEAVVAAGIEEEDPADPCGTYSIHDC